MNKIRRMGKQTDQTKGQRRATAEQREGEAAVAQPESQPSLAQADANGAVAEQLVTDESTAQPLDGAQQPSDLATLDELERGDLAPTEGTAPGPESTAPEVEAAQTADAAVATDMDAVEAPVEADIAGAQVVEEEKAQAVESGQAEMVAPEAAPVEAEPAEVEQEIPGEEERDEDETAPLKQVAEPEPEDLTPLPVNAVVDHRYVVQSQLHHNPERNLYRVTTRRQQRCATCGRPSPAELDTCPQCGAALDGQEPAEFYLMAESYRPEALIQDAGLMELHLYHPNLVPVIDFFNYKPFGRTRYFAVAEPRQGVRLSQLSLPRPGAQVLSWAMQLADALDYLHNQGVVGAGAEADDILVQGDTAALASLQNARVTITSQTEQKQQQIMDLARLAATIYEAYTGSAASISPEGVLPMPAGAPEQVGAAFRSAIEPVQGAAPSISVAQWRDLLAIALEAVTELARPGRPVSFVSACLTDVGRLREQNQDSFGMCEFVQASVERPMKLGLYIVADGMGGHKGGEIASALAVQSLSGETMGRIVAPLVAMSGERTVPSNEAILQGMTRAVQTANERIFKARNNRQNDMGTTLVAAIVAGGKAYISNVGDSRFYLYSRARGALEPPAVVSDETSSLDSTRPLARGTSPLSDMRPDEAQEGAAEGEGDALDRSGYSLTQVSIDHSLVHRLVELGQLDPEEAKVHPHRNFIYRSLGGPPPIEVDTFVRTLRPGDRLLLCSDGLNSMVEDADIESVLASEEDPQVVCQRLIELANEAGGHDNITAIVIDVTGYLPLAENPLALENT